MGRIRTVVRTASAGDQFDGSGFDITPRFGRYLLLTEINLHMGTEPKRWQVVKRVLLDNGTTEDIVLLQSVDPSSALPGETSDANVIATGSDIETLLSEEDTIAVVTTGATHAILAKIYFFEGNLGEIGSFRSK